MRPTTPPATAIPAKTSFSGLRYLVSAQVFEGNAPRVVLPFKELLVAVEVGALLEEDVFSRSISVCFCVDEVSYRLLVEV